MRLALVLLSLTTIACSADSGTGTEARFPDVAGTYTLTGTFDDVPAGTFSGTLRIEQASRDDPAIAGLFDIALDRDPGATVVARLVGATVDEAGAVAFEVGQGSSSTFWRFTGTQAASRLTGRHTLSTSGRVRTGTWTARR